MITSSQIKELALSLGFDACGICRAEEVDLKDREYYRSWLDSHYHADMDYMGRNRDKRCDPQLLVEGAKSIICVALNYYPQEKQPESHPQLAYYAYGKDYHEVVKAKLQQLFNLIKEIEPEVSGRAFVDTAPVLERYWAAKAGIGFTGKNTMLIVPKKGSYFFLGELIVNLETEYDAPLNLSCGNCTRCIDACPAKAIVEPKAIDSRRCISYQTIENKGEIGEQVIPVLNNRLYGCDICQQACPWNRFAGPHNVGEFVPAQGLLELSFEKLDRLTVEEYQRIFKVSAVKRAKYAGLKRNLEALRKSREA